MASRDRSRVRVDRDGVRTVYDPRAKLIVTVGGIASALVVIVAIAVFSRQRTAATAHLPGVTDAAGDAPALASEVAEAPASRERRTVRAVHVERAPAAAADPPLAAEPAVKARPELLARDVIPALVAAGEKEGIAAFPPPGTEPIKRGIVVPDDFELPPGYARHYQTTDDGERLAAILMFAPNYEFVDEHGAPIALPDDGIVPPEMAPPGLPIRRLRLPRRKHPDRPS
jgi:hypothetical protein